MVEFMKADVKLQKMSKHFPDNPSFLSKVFLGGFISRKYNLFIWKLTWQIIHKDAPSITQSGQLERINS